MIDIIKLPENEHKALCYAEKYGIIEYKVKGNRMIYKVSYPLEHVTMIHSTQKNKIINYEELLKCLKEKQ